MKVTVIGGGSTYTPELVNGFINRADRFPIRELWLMDSDLERLEIVGGFAKRMVASEGRPFQVILSTDQRESIQGCSYTITQLRVGKMQARREDEYLGARHGLIGQETTGIGGMAKALRTIPVILEIARDMEELAPRALLVNFTNPAGLVTEALQRCVPQVPSVGVCNVAINTKMQILADLKEHTGENIDPHRANLDTLGLNHLTWNRGFTVNGKDIWPQVFEWALEKLRTEEDPFIDPRTMAELGMIPNYYLEYYYQTEKRLKKQRAWPPSRAEEVIQVEKDLLQLYSDPALTKPPADLMKRGGAYYSTLATRILEAHHNDLGEIHIVNVPNDGAVPEWTDDWVLEMPCRVDASGIHPLQADPLPGVCFGLLAQVKAYELLTVEAAVFGDRNAAYQALLSHPLGPDSDCIEDVLEDLIITNSRYLPQF